MVAFAVGTLGSAVGPQGRAAAEQDGPAPVNTTRSVSAGAGDDISPRGDVADVNEPQHAAGVYMGVVPGATTQPPAAVRVPKAGNTITWPGFQMRPDGSSRVFIQSTAPIEAQPTAAAGKFVVHLPGARVAADTNRLPLDTRFFNTPVTKVSLSVDRTGATLALELRSEVTPQISSERDNTGYYFTYIDLPKGSYVASKPGVGLTGPAANNPVQVLPEDGKARANPAVSGDAAVSGHYPSKTLTKGSASGRISLHD
ncbi:MAG: hypothetical protein RL701_7590 [Pseudomonadota bacterium]